MGTYLRLVSPAEGRSHGTRKTAKKRSGSSRAKTLAVKITQLLPLFIPPLLFLLAFGLRASGTRFGLPEYFYHPDEHAIVDRATAILRTGDFNPHWFNYPSTFIYIQALTYVPYFLVSAARGFGDRIPSLTPYGFYFAGRLMTAFMGALTVPLVFVLGRRVFDRKTGLLSSLLLTFSLLHAVHSHYVTADVPVALFITLAFLFCYVAMDEGATKCYVLAGLFAGLAASTKYPAFIAILPLLLVPLLTIRRAGWTALGQRVGLSLGAFVAGFLLGTPYAFLDLNTFLSSLGSVLSHYSASQPGFEGSDAGVWYATQMLRSADVTMVSIGLGGILWAVYKHTRKDLLMLSFLVPYYVLLSLWRVRFERHLVALLPFLIILAARFLVEGASWLSKRWPLVRKGEIPLLGCLSVLAILMPAKAIMDFDAALTQKDHRTIAAEWVNANIPAGSKLVSEAFSIPLDEERLEVEQVVRIDSQDLDWYRQEGVEYIIVSDGHWRVLFGEPEKYAREIKTYNDILNHSTVLNEFSKEVPSSLAQGYFTIPVYHFPDVLILKLE